MSASKPTRADLRRVKESGPWEACGCDMRDCGMVHPGHGFKSLGKAHRKAAARCLNWLASDAGQAALGAKKPARRSNA